MYGYTPSYYGGNAGPTVTTSIYGSYDRGGMVREKQGFEARSQISQRPHTASGYARQAPQASYQVPSYRPSTPGPSAGYSSARMGTYSHRYASEPAQSRYANGGAAEFQAMPLANLLQMLPPAGSLKCTLVHPPNPSTFQEIGANHALFAGYSLWASSRKCRDDAKAACNSR